MLKLFFGEENEQISEILMNRFWIQRPDIKNLNRVAVADPPKTGSN